ncbi:STAS domain-containing protein [Ectopseudomonas guguanensis]|jgi:anti-anti-sigma factor|uniref:Anti-anti-sigma factor n=1 Tax=Ectopseudomonas guguanensis TaxID=1198456 RepID=A0A1H0KE17_9GAMM|nr:MULTISPECIES: STAS domain-containing protein [Pseudomonas]MPT18192.1 STAS domain-containing protein [Pseudomonas sp.]WJH56224.1 STAS domain-containing protein [Pseudomonas guguanensis]SDO54060.1 anti-anti-sigma factor [Pseudomonas guguanensis]
MFELIHEPQQQPERLTLVGSLTIYEVRQAHEALLAALSGSGEGSHWQLALDQLEELDSAGAQLLLALQRQLTQRQTRLEVISAADGPRELLDVLHLHSLLPAHPTAQA